MKITNHQWKLSRFTALQHRIEAQPVYQRGPVWPEPKQRLLIDSIIRGLDIPKIYLHRLKNNPMFDYQIVDGQQRLTAIWKFAANELSLALPEDLADASWADCTFDTLSETNKEKFQDFAVIVAIVENADDDHIRDLFSRLQMGERLTPPEIRNSIRSVLGTEIRNLAENHRFFRDCEFADTRFKHHDLAAHAFALEIYRGVQDLKAPNLKAMYIEHADTVRASLPKRVASILDILHDVQTHIPGWINRKWGFVDLYFVLSEVARTKLPAPDVIAERYKNFEIGRRKYVARPERIIRRDQSMFSYIKAFQIGGGLAENLNTRHQVLKARLLHGK